MPVMNESWRISKAAGWKKIFQELLEDDDIEEWRRKGGEAQEGARRGEDQKKKLQHKQLRVVRAEGRKVCRRRQHFVWLIEATVAQADDR